MQLTDYTLEITKWYPSKLLMISLHITEYSPYYYTRISNGVSQELSDPTTRPSLFHSKS